MKHPSSYPHPYKNLEVLSDDYHFNDFGINIVIKKGFPWDGASIPAIADRIVGHKFEPDNKLFSLIHDALFRCGIVGWNRSNRIGVEVLKKRKNVGRFRAWLVMQGLRLGSWPSWRSHRKRPKEWQLHYIEDLSNG